MADASTTQLIVVAAAGGLAGNLLTTVTKRLEFRREDRARWLTERESACVAFLQASSTVVWTMHQGDEKGDISQKHHDDALLAVDVAAENYERIYLLTTTATTRAATAYNDAVTEVVRVYTAPGAPDIAARDQAVASATAAKDAFREAARRELSIERRRRWLPRKAD